MPNSKLNSFILTIFISCTTLVIFCVSFSIIIFLSQTMSFDDAMFMSYSNLTPVLIVGFIQGLLIATFNQLRKSKTFFSFCLSSFAVTEFLIILSVFFEHFRDNYSFNPRHFYSSLITFLGFSILYLIPCITIGIINKIAFNCLKTKERLL